jgi:hypothetical protein
MDLFGNIGSIRNSGCLDDRIFSNPSDAVIPFCRNIRGQENQRGDTTAYHLLCGWGIFPGNIRFPYIAEFLETLFITVATEYFFLQEIHGLM